MYCRNCGKEIPERTNFCPNCGANQNVPLNTNQQNVTKITVGNTLPSDLQRKPPKKKKSPLKIIGIVFVILFFISVVGRIRQTLGTMEKKETASSETERDIAGDAAPEKNQTESVPEPDPSETPATSVKITPSTEAAPRAEPAPEEEVPSDADTEAEQKIMDPDSITPEFKEMMDSYEAWFDNYIEFMQSYEITDDPISMTQKYSEFLLQYADVMKKINAVNQNELSPADAAYYLEVTARIYQKLATIQ